MNPLSALLLASAGKDLTPGARYRQFLTLGALFLALAGAIGALAGGFWLINLTAAYAAMLALMGTNLLFGQLGLVSLCQFALVGVGGWVTLRLSHAFHPPFEVTMLAGGAAASIVGVIWGLPALRFRGIYLALVTLMLAGAFQTVIGAWNFPGGGSGFFGTAGMEGRPRLLMQRPPIATGDTAYFFYVALICLIGLWLVELHRRSKPGRAWALIRKDPQLATASGVRIMLYQAWAFALAGFLAGISGALLAALYGQLDATGFTAVESITLFAASVLGGTSNWVGTLIGGILVRAVPTLLDTIGISATVGTSIFGIGLMAAIIGGPTGIAGLFDRLIERLGKKSAQKQIFDRSNRGNRGPRP
jgi:branched-chain amino acid transport system permease protein